jgi:hypothetical protein
VKRRSPRLLRRRDAQGTGPSDSDARLFRRSAQATIAALVATVAASVLTVLGLLGCFSAGVAPAHIRPEQLIVVNTTQVNKQQVEVSVLNTGSTRTLIKSATLRVLRVFSLPICASEGELPPSATYEATLPSRIAGSRTVVHVPIHDQAGPDEADRFVISLGSPQVANERFTLRVYQVALSITDGPGNRVTPVGKFLISLPFLPSEGEQYWSKKLAAESPRQLANEVGSPFPFEKLPCWRANTTALLEALKLPGTRSSGLERLNDELAAPTQHRPR